MSDVTAELVAEFEGLAVAEPGASKGDLAIVEPRQLAAYGAPEVDWVRLEREAILISQMPGAARELQEPAGARFVAYIAQRFGTDPVMTATKVYFTTSAAKKSGDPPIVRVGFEAQLIHALIEGDPMLMGPLKLTYGYADPTKKIATGRFLQVSGWVKGADAPAVLTTPTVAQIGVKQSPLWFADPDQQLAYYGVRAWARRYRPSRILGIYERGEIELIHERQTAPSSAGLFEEDEAKFDGVPESDAQRAAGQRWHDKAANGGNDSRDPRDDNRNAAPNPEAPPSSEGNQPSDLAGAKDWAEAERVRIIALSDPDALAAAAEAFVADKRFKRVVTYDRADAARIDRSIRNRIEELRS